MKIFLILLLVLYAVCAFMLFRNQAIYKERGRMIRWVYEGEDWKQRQEIYDAGPSYDDMMYKFWKPVKSFYWEYLSEYTPSVKSNTPPCDLCHKGPAVYKDSLCSACQASVGE